MKLTLYDSIQELFTYSESGVKRVGTGIKPIDEKIRGVAPGEICMILGRSFSGKSMVAQNIILNNHTLPSIFFSMEMPYVQALPRLYAMYSGMNSSKVMDLVEAGKIPQELWELVTHFKLHAIVEEPNLGFEDMSRYLDKYQEGFGVRPDFVVVDYLELVGGAKRSGEGMSAVDSVTTELKDWAKQEKMRVFVLHQCNRNEPIWHPPTEDSPRFGGYTESDVVIGLWKPSFDPEISYEQKMMLRDDLNINIIKNRTFGDLDSLIRTRVLGSMKVKAYSEFGREADEISLYQPRDYSATSGS